MVEKLLDLGMGSSRGRRKAFQIWNCVSKDKEVESTEHTWKGGWEGKKQEARNEAGVTLWKAGRPGGRDQCSFCP